MKIVTIDKSLMLKYAGDPEILQKDNRPCVLIVRLKYKGKNQDFAVPLRSNIKDNCKCKLNSCFNQEHFSIA